MQLGMPCWKGSIEWLFETSAKDLNSRSVMICKSDPQKKWILQLDACVCGILELHCSYVCPYKRTSGLLSWLWNAQFQRLIIQFLWQNSWIFKIRVGENLSWQLFYSKTTLFLKYMSSLYSAASFNPGFCKFLK